MKTPISLNNKTILITGAAGFIGAALTQRILKECNGVRVIGLDNMNDYYDPTLKEYRLEENKKAHEAGQCDYAFIRGNIADRELIDHLFEQHKPDIVVNLAAQAGVRYSIDHPDTYIESNIIGFYNIQETCRALGFGDDEMHPGPRGLGSTG